MNFSTIRPYDIANGDGIRTTLFVSGCTFGCNGCFNEEIWDFTSGQMWTDEIKSKFLEYGNNTITNGYSILGGEPFQQDDDLYELLTEIKSLESSKSVWVYTGYTLETIPQDKWKWLYYIDILVDGLFEIEKKDIRLKFRGSKNQRIIDVPRTLKTKKIITLYD